MFLSLWMLCQKTRIGSRKKKIEKKILVLKYYYKYYISIKILVLKFDRNLWIGEAQNVSFHPVDFGDYVCIVQILAYNIGEYNNSSFYSPNKAAV